MNGGYRCDQCGAMRRLLSDWLLGRHTVDPETGNKRVARYCSVECAVVYLLRRDDERVD